MIKQKSGSCIFMYVRISNETTLASVQFEDALDNNMWRCLQDITQSQYFLPDNWRTL